MQAVSFSSITDYRQDLFHQLCVLYGKSFADVGLLTIGNAAAQLCCFQAIVLRSGNALHNTLITNRQGVGQIAILIEVGIGTDVTLRTVDTQAVDTAILICCQNHTADKVCLLTVGKGEQTGSIGIDILIGEISNSLYAGPARAGNLRQ